MTSWVEVSPCGMRMGGKVHLKFEIRQRELDEIS